MTAGGKPWRTTPVRRIGVMVLVGALVFGRAAVAGVSEYRVKAAFLYNFARFIEWPETAFDDKTAPLVFCILDPGPFGDAFETIRDKTVRGRPVAVRPFDPERKAEPCHVVFINTKDGDAARRLLSEVFSRKGVLTAGETQGFARQGGVINFFITEENKIRFEINIAAARRAGLKISSKLLKLAEIVSDAPEQ